MLDSRLHALRRRSEEKIGEKKLSVKDTVGCFDAGLETAVVIQYSARKW